LASNLISKQMTLFSQICEAIESNNDENAIKLLMKEGLDIGIPFQRNFVWIKSENRKEEGYARYLHWREVIYLLKDDVYSNVVYYYMVSHSRIGSIDGILL
jgi:hypothetical protein